MAGRLIAALKLESSISFDENGLAAMRTADINSPRFPEQIVVLSGGDSAEREISLASGVAVARALTESGARVQLADPADVDLRGMQWPDSECVVFNMLHGSFGEDGQVQSQLDELKVPYTGSSAEVSRIAFHKNLAKQVFAEHDLATPMWRLLDPSKETTNRAELAESIGYPLVVKPAAQGSSLGVSIVHTPDELDVAVQLAQSFDQKVVLEAAIIGEEWTVPVIDDRPLPAIRVTAKSPFFDYSAKYQDDATGYEVFRAAEHSIAQLATDLSVKACQALGTAGIARVDLMVDHAGKAWLLEVNTIPGMTDHSLVPKAATSLGWTMAELCQQNLFSAFSNRSRS